MPKVCDVFAFLDAKSPCEIKMDFDNVGLLAGSGSWPADRILVSLDITNAVIDEAVSGGYGLIVSHHPIMFSTKTAADTDATGAKLVKMLSNGVAAICMHTNLDAVSDGVNDALAEKLGLCDISLLSVDGADRFGRDYGIGRVGELCDSMPLDAFLQYVKTSLDCNGLRYVYGGRDIRRVAVGGGSCSDYLRDAVRLGCDAFVTADVKYDTFILARDLGITLVDADHFCTENVVVPRLKAWLEAEFAGTVVDISAVHAQTTQFFA